MIIIPDKTENKNTTSLKFKNDLINFFKDKNLKTCLEIGTNHGWTARILADVFDTVYTVDHLDENTNRAKENTKDKSNIFFYTADAYNTKIWSTMPMMDVVFIDCVHTYEHVLFDINTGLSLIDVTKGMYFIFDDYGLPDGAINRAVTKAVDDGLTVEKFIGHGVGYKYNDSLALIDHEGIILSYGK